MSLFSQTYLFDLCLLLLRVGDFVGSGLSLVLVWRPAKGVSNGNAPDAKKLKKTLNHNWCKGFAIGLVPIAGDFFDSWIKFNVKSADALEAMLLKRVEEGTATGGHVDRVVSTTGHQHAVTSGQHPTAIASGHHESEPPTHPPRRFVGGNDLRAATAQVPKDQKQPNKSAGTLFQRRKGPKVSHDVGTTVEEVAPGPPYRPEHSNYEHGGHF